MNNFGEQINLVINNLSEKLGIAVDKIYPALKHQAFIDGITDLIWITIGITLIISAIIATNKIIKNPKLDKYGEWSDINIPIIIFSIVGVIVGFLMISSNFHNALTALFNPDYYIVNEILNKINVK